MDNERQLYKRDSKGKLRSWHQELFGDKYRTIAGLVHGTKAISGWTICVAKNVDRANATTPEQQAEAEVTANYIKKLGGEYYETIEETDTPKYFMPMLAKKFKDRKGKIDYNGPVWVQPKLDGIRCTISKTGMISRKGKPIVSCPHIRETLAPVFDVFPTAIFDGELYNHILKDDFEQICSLIKRTKTSPESLEQTRNLVQYHMYDFPGAGENERFDVRFGMLVRFLDTECGVNPQQPEGCLRIVGTHLVINEAAVDNCHDMFIEQGYEGSMIRLPGPYAHNHCNQLLKRKDFDDAEFEIIRIEEGNGNWSGCAKRLIFKLADGRESAAGMKGKMPYLKQVLAEADQYIGKQASIRYFGFTKNGMPRIAVVQALHKTERM